MTAVLSTHIVVDNDYKIFDLAGNLTYHAKMNHTKVFDVQWRPGHFTKLPKVPKPDVAVVTKTNARPGDKVKPAKPRRIMRRIGWDDDSKIQDVWSDHPLTLNPRLGIRLPQEGEERPW